MTRYCTRCGHIGEVKTKTPGSFAIEIALLIVFVAVAARVSWLLLIAPLIYSLWRWQARHNACAECGSRDVVPLTSPVAQQKITESTDQQHRVAVVNQQHGFCLAPRTIAALAFVALVAALLLGGVAMDALGKVFAR